MSKEQKAGVGGGPGRTSYNKPPAESGSSARVRQVFWVFFFSADGSILTNENVKHVSRSNALHLSAERARR